MDEASAFHPLENALEDVKKYALFCMDEFVRLHFHTQSRHTLDVFPLLPEVSFLHNVLWSL